MKKHKVYINTPQKMNTERNTALRDVLLWKTNQRRVLTVTPLHFALRHTTIRLIIFPEQHALLCFLPSFVFLHNYHHNYSSSNNLNSS